MSRTATVDRETKESKVHVSVDLDGSGRSDVSTGVGFFDHMLGRSAPRLVDLTVTTDGDTHIDAHHTVEDTAIVLGQALHEALGDKAGIRRFGDALVPLDEALVQCAIDVSGRPYCVHAASPTAGVRRDRRRLRSALTRHVFETLAFHAQIASTSGCCPAATPTTWSRRSSRRSPGPSVTRCDRPARDRCALDQGVL